MRIPSRLAHRTRPVQQCRTAATLSRLLPPSPATPGLGCLQLHPAAAPAGRRTVSHLHPGQQRLVAHCRSCWIRCADGSGIPSCWYERATPRSAAPARSAPHAHVPSGNQSRVSSGSAQLIADPGAPGCLPRFRFFSASRCAARRSLRGGLRPGRSSPEGGIDEFPLLRDSARSSRATWSRSPAMSASSAAIRPSRAVQLSHSGAAGGRPDTSHDHPEPAGSKQADTPGRLTTTTSQPVNHPPSETSGQARQGVNVYILESPANNF